MGAQKRPVGLMLLSALLLIVALRALGWLVIGSILARRMPGSNGAFVGLLVTATLLIIVVGLLRLREWARWLALIACSVYFGLTLVNVVAQWPRLRASGVGLGLGLLNAGEAVIVLTLTWWYLNRREVRRLFQKANRERG